MTAPCPVSRTDAATAYRQRQEQISRLLQRITAGLKTHEDRQQQRPADWGFAGDLADIERQLANIVATLKA